jgi:hypothetical protein
VREIGRLRRSERRRTLWRRNRDDFEKVAELAEVRRVTGVEGKPARESGGCDEQIEGTPPPRRAADGGDRRVDSSVTAEIAISEGRSPGSTRPRSITTDVSTSPRA